MILPPGPRMPVLLQGIGWWHRPTAFMERCRARYGKRFTIRLPGQPPFVMISEPDQLARDVHGAARCAPPGGGRADPRAGRGPLLGDPARRSASPRAAQADAARLPRRQDAAAYRAHGGARRAGGGQLANRGSSPAPSALPGAHAGDHPARRVRPGGRRAPRRPARAIRRGPRVRHVARVCEPALSAELRGLRSVRRLHPSSRRGGQPRLRPDRRAPPFRRAHRGRAVDVARRAPRGRVRDVARRRSGTS